MKHARPRTGDGAGVSAEGVPRCAARHGELVHFPTPSFLFFEWLSLHCFHLLICSLSNGQTYRSARKPLRTDRLTYPWHSLHSITPCHSPFDQPTREHRFAKRRRWRGGGIPVRSKCSWVQSWLCRWPKRLSKLAARHTAEVVRVRTGVPANGLGVRLAACCTSSCPRGASECKKSLAAASGFLLLLGWP